MERLDFCNRCAFGVIYGTEGRSPPPWRSVCERGTEQVGVGLSQAGPFSQVKSESPPGLGVLVLSSVIPTLFMSRLSEF